MKTPLLALAILSIFALTPSANAIVVTETTDFPGSASYDSPWAYSVGSLTAGVNSISGSLSGYCVYDCNSSPAYDGQDSFLITVPVDLRLDSISVAVTDVLGPPGFAPQLNFMGPSTYAMLVWQPIPLSTTTVDLLNGVYAISIYGGNSGGIGEFSLNYNVILNASSLVAVPTPDGLSLFGVGLLILLAFRSRRILIVR
jgi:hypothetical protein